MEVKLSKEERLSTCIKAINCFNEATFREYFGVTEISRVDLGIAICEYSKKYPDTKFKFNLVVNWVERATERFRLINPPLYSRW